MGIRMPAGSARTRLHVPGKTRVAISEAMVNGSVASSHLSCWRPTRSARRQRSVTLAAAPAAGDDTAPDGQDRARLEEPVEPGDDVRVVPVAEQRAQVLRVEGETGDGQRDERQRRPQRGPEPPRQQPALREDQQQDHGAQAGGGRVGPVVDPQRRGRERQRTGRVHQGVPHVGIGHRGERVRQPDQAEQRAHRMTGPPGQQHAPHPGVGERGRQQEDGHVGAERSPALSRRAPGPP